LPCACTWEVIQHLGRKLLLQLSILPSQVFESLILLLQHMSNTLPALISSCLFACSLFTYPDVAIWQLCHLESCPRQFMYKFSRPLVQLPILCASGPYTIGGFSATRTHWISRSCCSKISQAARSANVLLVKYTGLLRPGFHAVSTSDNVTGFQSSPVYTCRALHWDEI
jgi:hypothetical protein